MSRAVGVASLLYGSSILLSRLLGLVREAVIGRTLGNGAEADAYWAAFVIPDFLNGLLASGLLSLVFIPLFQRHLAQKDEAAARASFSALFTVVAIAAVVGTVVLWWATPRVVPWVAPGLDAAGQARLAYLTRIVLPAQIFHILGGLLSATLQARERHLLPALAPLIYVGGIIAGGLLLANTLGAEGFAWGVLGGSILGPFGLPLVGALRTGLRWRLSLRHPDVAVWFRRSIPVMLGASVVLVDDWFHKHFGSELAAGSISRLQYARTLMRVPLGVFGMAAGIAAFPTLSRMWAEGRTAEARGLLTGALRTLWVLVFVAAAGLAVAADDVARVIWGTQRFSPAELDDIGRYTALMCLGLWAWSAQLLLARGFYAAGRTWAPTVLGTAITVAGYPMYAVLAHGWGGEGLAVASSVALAVYCIALAFYLARLYGVELLAPLGDGLVRMTLAGAAGWAAGTGVDMVLPAWPALIHGTVAGGVACGVTLAAAHLLGVAEVKAVVAKVSRRLPGRARRAG